MTDTPLSQPDLIDFLDALTDAEWEMRELGSSLAMPCDVRFRLLQAANRAFRIIEASEMAGLSG